MTLKIHSEIFGYPSLSGYEEYVCEFQGRRGSVERLSFEKKRFLKVKNYLSYIEMTKLE